MHDGGQLDSYHNHVCLPVCTGIRKGSGLSAVPAEALCGEQSQEAPLHRLGATAATTLGVTAAHVLGVTAARALDMTSQSTMKPHLEAGAVHALVVRLDAHKVDGLLGQPQQDQRTDDDGVAPEELGLLLQFCKKAILQKSRA